MMRNRVRDIMRNAAVLFQRGSGGSRSWLLVAAIATAITVAGCREDEAARKVHDLQSKGTYAGQADDPINDETREQLRRRIDVQRF